MGEDCSATQLIDANRAFNVDGLDRFLKEVKLADYGLSYAVVSIIGPQSSGESDRLPRSLFVSRCTDTTYCLLRFLVEHSYINSKSLTFGYLDEKPVDTGLMKFLGLCHFALSEYLEFASVFSTSSAPFTTNALPP
ncbi:hypothetical protein BHE74_00015612 [Ensete ventricosum]|nr:hypothetical protein BHE74_00015612 [Ensete ventricosum]